MDADSIVEVVPEEELISVEETRRMFVMEHGARYIDESVTDIVEQLKRLVALENWLIDGTLPPPKPKLKVVSDEK